MNCAVRLFLGALLLSPIANAQAAIVPSPAQVDFGDQAVGTTSEPKATTFINTGSQAVTVMAVSAVTLEAYARVGGTCGEPPFTIAPQASCSIEHTFTPYLVQSYYGYAHLTLAEGGRVDFGLAGDGEVAYLDIQPSSSWFFPVAVGATSDEQTIYLSNTRSVGMTVTQWTSSGPDVGAFLRTGGNCPSETPFYFGASSSCTVIYRFRPTHVGDHSMSVSILGSGSFGFSMSGDGLPEVPVFKNGFEVPTAAPIE
ncbi:choice-of-anchor D domain-containing protein [Tahibacter caeni]|uniref:choice-of-anchor D domain-containing protein n=1 Tax=Tahibacter caeni TaxID=1453545 RepID=UPI00214888C8|nr:choice-of-anchor D domain-containing protein [Tahibacter caeni]